MIAAVVPAAGRSARMGRAKLLLPIDGTTIIARVVTALRRGGADRVIVVAPPADAPEGPAIAAEARPTAERGGVLTVSCSGSVWAHELDLLSPVLIERLNGLLRKGEIVRLRCLTVPGFEDS